jgi:hypothetical protein
MLSGKFCGCKAVDYFQSLPGKLCITLKSSDLDSVLIGYDQVFRRILKRGKDLQKESPDSAISLYFIVDASGSDNVDVTSFEQKIYERLARIQAESGDVVLGKSLRLRIIMVTEGVDAVASARAALREDAPLAVFSAAAPLAELLHTQWTSKLQDEDAVPLLSPVQ